MSALQIRVEKQKGWDPEITGGDHVRSGGRALHSVGFSRGSYRWSKFPWGEEKRILQYCPKNVHSYINTQCQHQP